MRWRFRLFSSTSCPVGGSVGAGRMRRSAASLLVGLATAALGAPALAQTDTTPPTLSSAWVYGATLAFTCDEALDETSVPAATDFRVKVDGSAVRLSTATRWRLSTGC